MANIVKMFGGILLIAIGATIIYGSNIYHLIDIFIIFGVILFIFGLYLIIASLLEKSNVTKLKKVPKKEIPRIISSNVSNKDNGPIKLNASKKSNLNKSNPPIPITSKKIVNTVKKVSEPLNPNKILNQPKTKNISNKRLNFTPNYEKPMKITRKPHKKNSSIEADVNLNNSEVSYSEKSEEIKKALASDDFVRTIHSESKEEVFINKDVSSKNNQNRIDTKDSNSLPIPKLLKSYVICSKGTITSQQAFEELVKHAEKEIFLEIPSLKDMTEEFLSSLSKLEVKMIIEDFDLKDMSYVLLIRALIEQGIEIKTIPSVNTINLISDNSHALIISENDIQEEYDIGAVYTDSKAISNIKSQYETSWEIANDLAI